MKNKEVIFQDWGLMDYQLAWDKQEAIFAETVDLKTQNRNNGTEIPVPNHLIFVEHPHVYTL
jgi:lipoyl(octanoyl) transferase